MCSPLSHRQACHCCHLTGEADTDAILNGEERGGDGQGFLGKADSLRRPEVMVLRSVQLERAMVSGVLPPGQDQLHLMRSTAYGLALLHHSDQQPFLSCLIPRAWRQQMLHLASQSPFKITNLVQKLCKAMFLLIVAHSTATEIPRGSSRWRPRYGTAG